MKPSVYFSKHKKASLFSSFRFAKIIKNALKINGVECANGKEDVIDIAHFVSLRPQAKINALRKRHIPLVASCLCCEDDPFGSVLDYQNKDGKRQIFLKPKARRFLNKMDLVLVPDEKGKEFLANEGVTSPMEVLKPAVNITGGDCLNQKELFYRYFTADKNRPLVLGMGEYSDNTDGINAFINAAKLNPVAQFYYLACEKKAYSVKLKLKHLMRNAPSNVHFVGAIAQDIYTSGLINADILMLPGYRLAGLVSVYDAIAAKCQLIVRAKAVFSNLLINGQTAYIGDYSETLTTLTNDFLSGKLQPTTEKAYQEITKQNLKEFGEKLINVYQRLTQNKKAWRNLYARS